MRETTQTLGRRGIALVVAAVIVLLAVALWLGGRVASGDEEAFGGTDAAATAQLEESGHEPWFQPLMPPAGGEIESGLFALQAGAGGLVLGYVVGRLRGRRRAEPAPRS